MKNKRQIEISNVISGIDKNLAKKNWKCLHPNCGKDAINSHLLQKNGVLNNVAEDGHLYEVKSESIFKFKANEYPLKFIKKGINEAFSLPLFCNSHDTDLFASIEKGEIDFNLYSNQLLFTYRAICAELRKKEILQEKFSRMLKSNIIHKNASESMIETLELTRYGYELGVKDNDFYKKSIEEELFNENAPRGYSFKTLKIQNLPVCASSIFSPTNSDHEDDPEREDPFEAVFFNLIPKGECSYVIIGYFIKHTTDWIKEYFDSWDNLSKIEIENKITNLLVTRTETWAMSPRLHNQISEKEVLQKILDYINNNALNLDEDQNVDFNLFELPE